MNRVDAYMKNLSKFICPVCGEEGRLFQAKCDGTIVVEHRKKIRIQRQKAYVQNDYTYDKVYYHTHHKNFDYKDHGFRNGLTRKMASCPV